MLHVLLSGLSDKHTHTRANALTHATNVGQMHGPIGMHTDFRPNAIGFRTFDTFRFDSNASNVLWVVAFDPQAIHFAAIYSDYLRLMAVMVFAMQITDFFTQNKFKLRCSGPMLCALFLY